MSRIKKFAGFDINESEAIHEDKQYYIDKGYISDPSIKSKEELIKKIEAEINPAWVAFADEQKIPMPEPKITVDDRNRGTYLSLTTGEIDDLGIFANVLSSCKFMFFSGRQVLSGDIDGEFLFKPTIWSSLNLSYEAKEGGSNGMNYQISDKQKSDVWYDILDGKFNTYEEQEAKEAGKA